MIGESGQKKITALILEDNPSDVELLLHELRKGNFDLRYSVLYTEEEFLIHLRQPVDIILADFMMPQFNAPSALAILNRSGLDIPFIIVSGTIGEEAAVEIMKAGAHDYIMKDNMTRLVSAVERELAQAVVRKERKRTEQSLKENEERFRSTLENMLEGAQILGFDWNYIYINNAAEEQNRRPKEELIGKKYMDMWPGIETTEVFRLIECCMNERTQQHIENEFFFPDGAKGWFDIKIQPIPEGVFILSVDITDRKHSEEALQLNEQKFRLLAENARDLIYRYQYFPQRCFEYVSPSVLEITGYTQEEFYLDPDFVFKLIHPEDQYLVHEAEQTKFQSDRTQLLRCIKKDGTIIWTEQRTTPVFSTDGVLIALEGISRDVTERIHAEEVLKESERFAHETVDALSSHIAILDEFGIIITVNKAWKEFAKNNSTQPLNCNEGANYLTVCDTVTGEDAVDANAVAAGIRNVMSGNLNEFLHEYSCHSPTEQRWFIARITRFSGMGPLRIVISHENITERKLTENALQQSEVHYRELFESNPQPMWVFDLQTLRFLSVNDTAIKKYGYTRKEFLSMTIKDIRPEEDIKRLEKKMSTRSKELEYSGIWKHRLKNGQLIHVEIVSHAFDYDGIEARLVLANDVTERIKVEQSFRESEERLRLSLQAANQGLYDLNVQTGETIVNVEYASQLGYDPTTFIETQELWIERLHPDDKERTVQAYADYVTGITNDYAVEFRQKTKQGKWKWILSLGKITEYDWEGKPLRMLGTHTDITQMKNDEESRLLQLTALESAANGILITTLDGTIVWANKAFTKITGYMLEEVLYKNPRFLNSGKQSKEYYQNLWDTILSGNVWTGEIINKRKDGTLYADEMTITPVRNANNAITHFVTIKQDITERRKAFEQIERQALILDEAHDAIILRDLEHRILYWNKGAERMYGWKAIEVIGKNARLILNNGEEKYDNVFEQLQQKGNFTTELIHYTKDQKEINVDVRLSIIKDPGGNSESILSISTDITEKKKLESQFLRSQRLDSLGTLAGGIAHDLNNVLSPILLSIEILKKSFPNERALKILNAAESSTRRGSDIIKQILVFARGSKIKKTAIQSRHLISEIFIIFKETFPRSITLINDVPNSILPILADPTQFQQVIMNLCVNARDAMPNGGTLLVTAENKSIDDQYSQMNINARPGQYVLFTISDTGIGIPHHIIDKIYDPFFTTKEVGKGTGLGLSTVHTIVRNHDGFIDIKSEQGKGTTFQVYFPAAHPSAEPEKEKENSLQLRGNGEVILVVDDEHSVCEVTKHTLEEFNYEVITASDGTEALALFVEHKTVIALVITDLMMPIMDGAQLVQALRRMSPSLKIIGSSGLLEKQEYSKNELGMNDFILKPYSADELLHSIKKVL